MQPNSIIQGDALTELRKLPDECVQCVITSPPYWGLRDYGVDGQLGLEKTPDEFVKNMVEVFKEVKRCLRKEGTLWLNIGDSYAGSQQSGDKKFGNEEFNKNRPSREFTKTPGRSRPEDLKPKDLVGIPWMLAFALRADGWYLRQDIIWSKPNPMPESVQDRCTKAHEYVFMLSKSPRYYYDANVIKTPVLESSVARLSQDIENQIGSSRVPGKTNGPMKAVGGWHENNPKTLTGIVDKQRGHSHGAGFSGHSGNRRPDGTLIGNGMANKRSVWTVSTMPFKEAHFATFPEKLIEPMVLAGAPPRGIILDPFMGAGTTGLVAKKLGRQYLGIELNPEYIKIAEKRLNNVPNPLF